MAGPRQLPPPLLLLLCALAVPPSGVAQHQPADDSCPAGAATTTAGCPAALPLAAALADNTPPTAALDALIFPLNRSHFLRRVWERRPHHFRQRRPADANAGLIGDAEDSFAGGGAGIEAFLSGLVSTSQEVRVSKMKADATRENNLRINAERRVVFDRHDTDHDGTLSRDEVRTLLVSRNDGLTVSWSEVDYSIDEADTDHNGEISRIEMRTVVDGEDEGVEADGEDDPALVLMHDVVLVRDGRTPRLPGHPRVSAETAALQVEKGYSLGVNMMQHRLSRSARLAAALGASFGGHQVSLSLYHTPAAGGQAFAPHYKTADIFVLQLHGSKRWTLYRPAIVPFVRDREQRMHIDPIEALTEQRLSQQYLTLRAGEVLYIPRGYLHEATAIPEDDAENDDGDGSLHLTATVHVSPSLTTVEALLHRAIAVAATATPTGGTSEAISVASQRRDGLMKKEENMNIQSNLLLHLAVRHIANGLSDRPAAAEDETEDDNDDHGSSLRRSVFLAGVDTVITTPELSTRQLYRAGVAVVCERRPRIEEFFRAMQKWEEPTNEPTDRPLPGVNETGLGSVTDLVTQLRAAWDLPESMDLNNTPLAKLVQVYRAVVAGRWYNLAKTRRGQAEGVMHNAWSLMCDNNRLPDGPEAEGRAWLGAPGTLQAVFGGALRMHREEVDEVHKIARKHLRDHNAEVPAQWQERGRPKSEQQGLDNAALREGVLDAKRAAAAAGKVGSLQERGRSTG